MKKHPKANLEFVLDALMKIRDSIPSEIEEFLRNSNAQDAKLMRLQDVGEQLSRIRKSF